MLIQTFQSKLPMKGFDKGIVRVFAWSGKIKLDTMLIRHRSRPRDTNSGPWSTQRHVGIPHCAVACSRASITSLPRYPVPTPSRGHISGIRIYDRQDCKSLAVYQLIVYKVHRPTDMRNRGDLALPRAFADTRRLEDFRRIANPSTQERRYTRVWFMPQPSRRNRTEMRRYP